MPTITAIIPTYNRRPFLDRCIVSVITQTIPVNEIIVVDDGSNDGTADWIRQRQPEICLITQTNQGVSAARNTGIRAAKSEWIALLDSDDCWLPSKIEKQIAALKLNPDYRICHTEEKWIYQDREKSVPTAYRKKGGHIYQDCLPLCAISPSTSLIQRSVFDEVGFFDESLPACEDYELWLRITSRLPVLLVDQALIEKHGGHSDQLSSERGLDRFRIAALQKIADAEHLTQDQRKATVDILVSKCRIYAKGAEKHGKRNEALSYLEIAEKTLCKYRP